MLCTKWGEGGVVSDLISLNMIERCTAIADWLVVFDICIYTILTAVLTYLLWFCDRAEENINIYTKYTLYACTVKLNIVAGL
jgi:hypothetical protein